VNALRAKIGAGGDLVTEAPQRRELGLKTGDEVLIHIGDNELHISSVNRGIERVQSLLRKFNRKR